MKINSIKDIDKLPSVLDVSEVNEYLLQLINVIKLNTSISSVIAAEAINNLISYQGYNEDGLSRKTSLAILEWTQSVYDSNNRDLIEICSANLANLTCLEVEDYLNYLINKSNSAFEKKELFETLDEISVNK